MLSVKPQSVKNDVWSFDRSGPECPLLTTDGSMSQCACSRNSEALLWKCSFWKKHLKRGKFFSFLDTYCIYCPRIPNPLGESPKSHSTQQREDNFTEQDTARMWDLPQIREVFCDRFRAESTFLLAYKPTPSQKDCPFLCTTIQWRANIFWYSFDTEVYKAGRENKA